MSVFLTLISKILPLYISIILGFVATFFLECSRKDITKILFYLLTPFVVINATINVKLIPSLLFLPIFLFLLSTIMAFSFLPLFKKFYHDETANLLALSASTGNTGNIGIPIAIIFFSSDIANVYIFTVLAMILYGNSIGYYISAKGNFTTKDSIKKVLKLPVLYAFIIGIALNLLHVKMPDVFANYITYIKGAYVILGMMLLGMGMEKVKLGEALDVKFLFSTLSIKFILWPCLILAFILIDKNYIHFLQSEYYQVMFLYSTVPLAVNTVTIATLLDMKPEKMSLAVLISTLFALFYIPVMMFWFIKL